jgi:hypothetical protein
MFSAGRVVAYLAVGLVENAAPSYESEVTPASLRGFVTGSLIMLVSGAASGLQSTADQARPLWETFGVD